MFHNVHIKDNREKLRKIVNPNLEESAAVLILKVSPHPFKSNSRDVADTFLI